MKRGSAGRCYAEGMCEMKAIVREKLLMFWCETCHVKIQQRGNNCNCLTKAPLIQILHMTKNTTKLSKWKPMRVTHTFFLCRYSFSLLSRKYELKTKILHLNEILKCALVYLRISGNKQVQSTITLNSNSASETFYVFVWAVLLFSLLTAKHAEQVVPFSVHSHSLHRLFLTELNIYILFSPLQW